MHHFIRASQIQQRSKQAGDADLVPLPGQTDVAEQPRCQQHADDGGAGYERVQLALVELTEDRASRRDPGRTADDRQDAPPRESDPKQPMVELALIRCI